MGEAGRTNCEEKGKRIPRIYRAGMASLRGKEGEPMMNMEKVAVMIMNAYFSLSDLVERGSQYLKRAIVREMDAENSRRVAAESMAVTSTASTPEGTQRGRGKGGPGTCWR